MALNVFFSLLQANFLCKTAAAASSRLWLSDGLITFLAPFSASVNHRGAWKAQETQEVPQPEGRKVTHKEL